MASGEWDGGGEEVKLSTNYEVLSTVAARLFGSGVGASTSHTCLAPLSFWRGVGGEA